MSKIPNINVSVFIMLFLLISSDANAQSFSFPSDCEYLDSSGHNSGQVVTSEEFWNQKVINVYIEDDIADEWGHCDSSLSGNITNTDVRDYLIDILEKYNLQTNTGKFVYRGLVHVDDDDQGDAGYTNSLICLNPQIDQTKPFLVIANTKLRRLSVVGTYYKT